MAGEDTEDRDPAHVGVRHGLEDEGRHRGVRARGSLQPLLGARLDALGSPPGQRGGALFDNGVGQPVDADELRGRADQHRRHRARQQARGEAVDHLLHGDLAAVEVALQQGVVGLGDGFLDLGVQPLRLLCERSGELRLDAHTRAPRPVVAVGLAGCDIDHPGEVMLLADRQVHGGEAAAQLLGQLRQRAGERGTLPVELVDEDDPRDVQPAGHRPDDLMLDLHPFDRRQHEDGEVHHPECRLGLADEVGVAGDVDEVDLVAVPLDGSQGQRDRKALFDLLGLEVADGVAVLDPADPRRGPGKVHQGLRERGLASPLVSKQADIAYRFRQIRFHPVAILLS